MNSELEAKIACPPSCVMPTSKETRVRSDGFSKSIPSVSPAQQRQLVGHAAALEVRGERENGPDLSGSEIGHLEHRDGPEGPRPVGRLTWYV